MLFTLLALLNFLCFTVSKCPIARETSRNTKCREKECKLGPSPLVFGEFVEFKLEFLRRFRWEIYSPRYNWFYNPLLSPLEETPCHTFKMAFSGIDVTLFKPNCPVPVCSTLKCPGELERFVVNNTQICNGLETETFAVLCRRVAYALNLVSACGEIRTVVLSKPKDEFPLGYNFKLVNNPLFKGPVCTNKTL